MTDNLKNSIAIIIDLYRVDKLSKEEVFTLLDTMVEEKSYKTYTIGVPIGPKTYPTPPSSVPYPSTNPWDNVIYSTTDKVSTTADVKVKDFSFSELKKDCDKWLEERMENGGLGL